MKNQNAIFVLGDICYFPPTPHEPSERRCQDENASTVSYLDNVCCRDPALDNYFSGAIDVVVVLVCVFLGSVPAPPTAW